MLPAWQECQGRKGERNVDYLASCDPTNYFDKVEESHQQVQTENKKTTEGEREIDNVVSWFVRLITPPPPSSHRSQTPQIFNG